MKLNEKEALRYLGFRGKPADADTDEMIREIGGEMLRTLTPMVERVCRLWLRLHGYGCRFAVEWDDINLQDLVEEAKAELYREQARRLRLENDEREEQT